LETSYISILKSQNWFWNYRESRI